MFCTCVCVYVCDCAERIWSVRRSASVLRAWAWPTNRDSIIFFSERERSRELRFGADIFFSAPTGPVRDSETAILKSVFDQIFSVSTHLFKETSSFVSCFYFTFSKQNKINIRLSIRPLLELSLHPRGVARGRLQANLQLDPLYHF